MIESCIVETNLYIKSIVDKQLVDFTDYSKLNISNYNKISSIPLDHMTYINSNNPSSCVRMFEDCASLTTLDLSSFNVESCYDMNSMFAGCKKLQNLNLINFKTDNVINMERMFNNLNSITELLVNFNTDKVKDMNNMFVNCSYLTVLDLTTWNTQNVTDLGHLCSGCIRLNYVYGEFDLTNCNRVEGTFEACGLLKEPIKFKNVPKRLLNSNNELIDIKIPKSKYTILNII